MFESPRGFLTAYALLTNRFTIFDRLIDDVWAVKILRTGVFFQTLNVGKWGW